MNLGLESEESIHEMSRRLERYLMKGENYEMNRKKG